MLQEKSVLSPASTTSARALFRQRRAVLVSVVVDGREVDSFEASEPYILRAALRPIYAHLPVRRGAVTFQAVSEEWLPFKLAYARHQSRLDSLSEAMEHIAA